MSTFKVGHARGRDWYQASEACLAQIGDVPAAGGLGFLYATDTLVAQLPEILEHFKQVTGVEHWVGTVGLGICSSGQEYFGEPAVAAMIATLPHDSFRVFPSIKSGLEDFVRANARWYTSTDSHFGIVHGDPRNANLQAFVTQLAEELVGGFLVGGLTSSQGAYPQIAQTITNGGISGVLFSGEVVVTTALTQGCTPIGGQHEITECRGNVAVTIDGRPAFDVFEQDVGELVARDPKRSAGHIFAGLPIRGSDTGDYLVRHLVGFDLEEKLLAVGETLEPGDSIMFCRRDTDSAYQDMLRMLNDIKARTRGSPKGGVYYSCVGRGPSLFGQNSEELNVIRQELGDLPLVGFFGNGEVSHNRLYGYTGVLTLFL
ncbi:MAG: FIST C-terminal domain-containing protein [Gammaproteobacteria bacterium]|nr:MAG: FIST C-terminal domain-containing protein [Gammaproteobacteria bacterium]